MKLKSLFVIGALSAVVSSGLNAQTTIRISASNGDRGPTQTAISNILTNWTFQGVNGVAASGGSISNATGSNYGVWRGTFAGQTVIVKVSYSGALAGISAVASLPQIEQRYVAANGDGGVAVLDPTKSDTPANQIENATADFGFSTNFQSTSPFNGTYNTKFYDTLVEEVVGVSPLGFYASPGFPVSAANITTQQAQLLYTTGALQLSYFTGNVADETSIVYAIGRDTNAGQRFGAYTEIGLGTSSLVKVWQPQNITSENTSFNGIPFGGDVGNHVPWPAELVGGVQSPTGAGGFSTGASLAPTLTRRITGTTAIKGGATPQTQLYPTATAAYYIGYLTPGDALTRVLGVGNSTVTPLYDGGPNEASRGVALNYNGVALHNAVNGNAATVNLNNVRSGRYTAWLYNRILKTTTFDNLPSTNVKKAFADALEDRIKNNDATVGGGIKIDNSFRVERLTDGGQVTPRF
ncbi:MAG: hypothetical protein EOP88_02410 [Verrucomicrobiaceae bacterium]|nr:MAG: hypothetical protein EOP88_02410 [Verrucomicrobiaceae bacterium]